ncbi:hypothetical protein FN846DRAFT_36902 [Sphaerosporella brunnea]|uniref:2,4-dienoyl-CoA reductase [(3E)-enoyl-CoA-producing] n=1 Tax=Sphaerosporella brunnea TaxID=1250544 RepID=A0A5J5F946_9PEZI|nr:hypothetical protein FN846DRAFT_36902 [Sphaerosporella brunnea]
MSPPAFFAKTHSSVWSPNLFADKVVLCTGGAGTICSVQVAALIKLGANAAILGRRAAHTSEVASQLATLRPGARVLGISCDVRDASSLIAAAEQTVKELGRIDFLIAGAAGNFLASVEQLSTNAFKSVMDIDVLGSYNIVKACLPYLKWSKGRILFVSATLHYTGSPFQIHVSAAKAAVDALSRVLAVELGPLGITSNVVAPGPIAGTEGISRLATESYMEAVRKSTPLQRLGEAYNIADATIFLFSEAGSYVNGDIIVVDGGAWHRQGSLGEYPDVLLDGTVIEGVRGMKGKKGESKL